jgi:hypothetical protein
LRALNLELFTLPSKSDFLRDRQNLNALYFGVAFALLKMVVEIPKRLYGVIKNERSYVNFTCSTARIHFSQDYFIKKKKSPRPCHSICL